MARTTGRSGFKMRSGNKSTFRMMGSSSPFRDPTSKTDPRTPHGHDHDDEGNEVTWGEEKVVGTKTTETPTSTDVTTDYQTKGTKKGKKVEKFAETPEEIAAWKEASEESKAKYRTSELSKERSATESTPKEIEEVEKVEEVEEKEKKWCHCKAYAQHTPGGSGSVKYRSYERYECGTPMPSNCTKPSKAQKAKNTAKMDAMGRSSWDPSLEK